MYLIQGQGMLRVGLVHILLNIIQDIIYKDNKLIIRNKPSKNLDDWTAVSKLYVSVVTNAEF
jgi:hypothetical protein